MEKFLLQARTIKAPNPPTGPDPSSPPKLQDSISNVPQNKRKKPVSKESTIRLWGLDWLATFRNESGSLVIHCIACRQLMPKTSLNNRGVVSNDPFITGTANTKKFSPLRHAESSGHKSSYGELN